MTCLEHLIENTLCEFEKKKKPDEILLAIERDPNLEYTKISAEDCYEICQYVYCTYLRCAIEDELQKLSTDGEIYFCE